MTGQIGDSVEPYLKIGEAVVLHINPGSKTGPRYRTFVRGWHAQSHILLDRPEANGRFAHLFRRAPCAVRFLAEGAACGFATHVIDWDTRLDKPYCRVTWPKEFRVVPFRKYERVEVILSCQVDIGGNILDGEIRDLSLTGCRLQFPGTVCEGAPVSLNFTLPDGLPVENVIANIRNVYASGNSTLCGCQFRDGQEYVQSDLAFFLAASMRRGSFRSNAFRLLMMEDNAEAAEQFRKEFEQAGWDVFVSPNVIEGLARLRMLPPSAVLVKKDQKDLPCLDAIRLLRSVRGLESLPVFVFGNDDPAFETRAAESGAQTCFNHETGAETICEAITGHFDEQESDLPAE